MMPWGDLEAAAAAIARSIERRNLVDDLDRLFVEIDNWNLDRDALERWESDGGR